ncbi:hypothetical protein [Chitinophaga sp. Cy-1792]|uniref:hypothetical protein n=1 Tax=Chitinophaga sp. Cy-1792 TaxID=2608339 RepID=UPI0014247BED|nr:hypothetical protein [Chitinophaga sp. Cy-1792]NIG56366.1 hypothetical protein [Chitinophaga sp. Cy-1792]
MHIFLNFTYAAGDNRNDVPAHLRHLLKAATIVRYSVTENGWILEQYQVMGGIYRALVHYAIQENETLFVDSNIDVIAINRSTKHEVLVPTQELISVGDASAMDYHMFIVAKGKNVSFVPGGGIHEISFFSIDTAAIPNLIALFYDLHPLLWLLPITQTQKLEGVSFRQNEISDWMDERMLNQTGFQGLIFPYQQRISVNYILCALRCMEEEYSQLLTDREINLAVEVFDLIKDIAKIQDLQAYLMKKTGQQFVDIEYVFKNHYKMSVMEFVTMAVYLHAYVLLAVAGFSIEAVADITRIGMDDSGHVDVALFKIYMEDYFKVPMTGIVPNL